MFRRLAFCLTFLVAAVGFVAVPARAAADFSVLVFSKTAGFRHDSIAAGIAGIQQLGAQNNFSVETTEDATQFNATNLARFQAVVWLSTTGDVLNSSQQAAFESYVRAGGGYVGVHAASDTEYDWSWYGDLVGAYFASHPSNQNATVRIEDTAHPSTAGLPTAWNRFDEWYNFRTNPRSQTHVLASLDESTYSGGAMGGDHPISWCRAYDGGRSWYTGMGHTSESFSETNFRTHLLGGIRYAAQGSGICSTGQPPRAGYNQVTLAKGVSEVGEPMGLTVLPNRGVLHTSRDGRVRYTDAAGNTKVALTLPVYTHDEEGLQSIKADPNFASNRWVYLYYAPQLSTPSGDAPSTGTAAQFAAFNGVNRLARYTVNADFTLDASSAVTILEVPTSRGMCCHVGGDIEFDAAGNLYLSTGDDTNPFDSSGYTPIDERSGRNPAFDAQRTAGNSNDLRGKVLRIKPNTTGGGYTIPSGNMFAPGTANTKPEVYAMGLRNPFKMAVDKATGVVYVGDYGPDAGSSSSSRGPAANVAFERITQPGFYGWPYCSNYNTPYIDFTFPSGPSGSAFNCAGGPANNSPNNTGITQLPPSRSAWLPYGGEQNPSALGSGGLSPMGGPVYSYSSTLASDVKFPSSMNGKVFLGEFGRRWIKTATVTSSGGVGTIEAFPAYTGTQVMDLEFGPDGALYVLDYGTGWYGGDANSALHRIEYNPGGRSPLASVSANPTSGSAPLTVQFSSAGTSDPDGDAITYAWDFTTDGSTDSTAANPTFTYTSNGEFTATLTVRDSTGRSSTASVVIGVGRAAVTLGQPSNGRLFTFGDAIPFQVAVSDPGAPAVDCSRVRVSYILGHDSHGHPMTGATGCSGTIQTTADGEHDASAKIFGVMVAEYTPVGSTTPVTSPQVVMQPRTRQAEHYGAQQGTTVVAKSSANGGNAVGFIETGDWISFTPYNLSGATSFTARVASAGSGGTITLRTGSSTGPVVGTATVTSTGGWETWTTVTGTLSPPSGPQTLFLVFTGGSGYLFDIDAFTLGGESTPPPTTTPPTTTPPPSDPSCTAAYSVTSQWSGGFQAEVRVTAGSASISGWTVTWTFGGGQTVSQSWNVALTSSGGSVTARNASYNGSIGAGASTAFGFIGSESGAGAPSLTCTAT